MLSKIEIRNLQTVNGILEEFRNSQASAEKGLKEIDEKYKAIIEKEKRDYKQTIANCKKEIEFWEKPIIKRYGKSISELLAKPEDVVEAEPENVDPNEELPFAEEEKVVDKDVVEEVAEGPKRDLDAEEDGDWEEKIESGEITRVEYVEKKEESTDESWEEEKKEVVVENVDADSNKDEFEEFPEEW